MLEASLEVYTPLTPGVRHIYMWFMSQTNNTNDRYEVELDKNHVLLLTPVFDPNFYNSSAHLLILFFFLSLLICFL